MYSQEITRNHRMAIVVLVDQSWSMAEKSDTNKNPLSKAEMVSVVTGQLIEELILRSYRSGRYRDYFDIAIIGYSNNECYSLTGNTLGFTPVTSLINRQITNQEVWSHIKDSQDSTIALSEMVSMWVEPHSGGNTPMMYALLKAEELAGRWCAQPQNRDSFPPLIFNISDGEASDCTNDKLRQVAKRIRSIKTSDGNALLVNIHISLEHNCSLLFPSLQEVDWSCNYHSVLADMSSEIPPRFNEYVQACRLDYAQPPFLAMGYNASMAELVAMLNIGTHSIDILS